MATLNAKDNETKQTMENKNIWKPRRNKPLLYNSNIFHRNITSLVPYDLHSQKINRNAKRIELMVQKTNAHTNTSTEYDAKINQKVFNEMKTQQNDYLGLLKYQQMIQFCIHFHSAGRIMRSDGTQSAEQYSYKVLKQ